MDTPVNGNAVDATVERLRGEGYKATPQRRTVTQAIAERRRPTLAEIREACPRVGMVTIYRTLALLCDLGLVRRLRFDSKDRYELRAGCRGHFICETCGRVFDLVERAPELGQALLRRANLEASVDWIEIRGRCHDRCAIRGREKMDEGVR